MADQNSEPKLIKKPIIPRNAKRLSALSAAVAGILLFAGTGAYFSGFRAVASPGPVTSVHAPIDVSCQQCHGAPGSLAELRCERCHDPLDSRHLGVAAHVLVGTGDDFAASHAQAMPCASCHIEHRGSGQPGALRAVDDRACGSCHGFRTLDKHPEFALVRSKAKSDVGIKLSHAGHLKRLAKTGTERCEACHEPAPDGHSFLAISFDRHCARCHVKGGFVSTNESDTAATGNVATDLLQPIGTIKGTISAPDTRGRQILTGFVHRDPWILDRLQRLTAVIDPNATNSGSRWMQLARAIAAAESTAAVGAIAGLKAEELDRWASALREDLDTIDRQRSAKPGTLGADAQSALKELAALVAPNDPSLAQNLASAAGAPAAPPPASADEQRRDLDARRAELRQLLDAIDARGDASVKKSVEALRSRVDALQPSAAGTADPHALLDRLDALQAAFAAVEKQAGTMVGSELQNLAVLTRQQVAAGVSGAEFGARQVEIQQLLTALLSRADPVQRRRIADLQSALIQVSAGDRGALSLEDRRNDKARLLERVLLQRELLRETEGPTDTTLRSEQAAMRSRIQTLQNEQAKLAPPRSTLAALPASVDAAAAAKGITGLLDACLYCHRLNAEGSALAPVRATLDQLSQANFSHKPHIAQRKCESCHTGAEASTSGDDTLLPDVASCRSCHVSGGQARADCASCHTYHSRTGATLGVARR